MELDNKTQKLWAVVIIILTAVFIIMAVQNVRDKKIEQETLQQKQINEVRTLITIIDSQNEQTNFDITSKIGEVEQDINNLDNKIESVRTEIPKLVKVGDCMLLENDITTEKHLIC